MKNKILVLLSFMFLFSAGFSAGAGVISVNKDTYKKEVFEHKGIVLFVFSSTGCAPCITLKRDLATLKEDAKYKDVKIVEIMYNKDNKPVFDTYGIRSAPWLLVFKNGAEAADRYQGHNRDLFLAEIRKDLDKLL